MGTKIEGQMQEYRCSALQSKRKTSIVREPCIPTCIALGFVFSLSVSKSYLHGDVVNPIFESELLFTDFSFALCDCSVELCKFWAHACINRMKVRVSGRSFSNSAIETSLFKISVNECVDIRISLKS